MAVVGQAIVAVRPDMGPFKREAERGVSGLKTKPVKLRADTAGFRRSLGGVSKAIALIGTGLAGVKVAGFLKDSVGAASDLSESLSKTRVVFGAASKEVEKFASTSASSLGISRQAALEATSTFGNLLTAMGLGRAPAADMSQAIVTLAGDLASFNNVKPEEALEALRSGLTGETEPLKKFGVNLNEATLKAKALAMGIGDGKKPLDAASKAQAAYALIMEQTKTAQGDFTRTSKGLANQQRILAANVENLKARIGAALLPVVTRAVSTFNDWLPAIQRVGGEIAGFIKTIANAKDWKARISIVWDKISEAKAALGKALFGTDVFKGQQTIHMPGLIDNMKQQFASIDWSSVGSSIATGVSAAVAAATPVVKDIGARIDEAVAAIRLRMPEFAQLGAEMIASIFVTLTDPTFWTAHWELAAGVALAVIPVGKFLKVGEVILGVLVRPFEKLGAKLIVIIVRELGKVLKIIESYSPKLAKLVGNLVEAAGEEGAKIARGVFARIGTVIKAALDKVPGIVRIAFRAIINLGIVQTIVAAGTAAKNFGARIVSGVVDKVKTIAAKVVGFFSQVIGVIVAWAVTAYNSALGLGKAIVEGIAAGIRASPGAVRNALSDAIGGAVSWARHVLGIGSPSRVFAEEIGKPMMLGMIVGVTELVPRLKAVVSQAVKDAVVAAKQNLASLASSLSSSVNAVLDARLSHSPAAAALRDAQAEQAKLDLQAQIDQLNATINDVASTSAEKAKAQADLAVLLAQQAYDAESGRVDAAKTANDRILADLAQALNRGLITQQDYQAQVVQLLKSQGVDYKAAGDELGLAFADGFLTQLNDMLDQARAIVRAVQPDINALSGGVTDPIATVRDEIREARTHLNELKKSAKDESGPGGKKTTANEKKQIDTALAQLKALQALQKAMEDIRQVNINVGQGVDNADLIAALNALIAAAER